MTDPSIKTVTLDALVDTSLKTADKVVKDKEIQGELWRMRHCQWQYWPYEFEVLYHVVHGMAVPLVFHFRELLEDQLLTSGWKTVADTSSYRELLVKADEQRAKRI